MLDIEKRLNPSQLAAVTTINGPLLVIAGAGSGKTRVIEYRVLYLVQNKVEPSSILLLTFTRKAARQMLDRATKHDPRCKDVEGGTFHSFCYLMLKKYAKTIGFPDAFSILDEGDAEELIHKCSARLGLFDKEKRFPKKETLRSIISMSVNKNISIEDVLTTEYPHFLEYTQSIDKLRKKYTEYKIDKNYLDYDDLLLYLKLLLENEEIRKRISGKYRYIMVDEYQDTNALQGDITFSLGKDHRNIMAVGDDAQSIYGFRGATHKNIMEFPDMFSGCKIIKLEENYRSTQSILDLSNSVLNNMKNKYSKCLVSARKIMGPRPNLIFFKDAYDEAEYIARKIKESRDEGLALNHQAVLFRSAYISIPLQAELSKRNIPYQVFGGLKFYETAHVKDVMAYLRIILNPKDELGWSRVLMLIEGIGPKTAERIIEEITCLPCLAGSQATGKINSISFNYIVNNIFDKCGKGYKFCGDLTKLKSVLKNLNDGQLNVGERFDIALDYYTPILQGKFDDWPLRLNDLETLRQIADRYDSLERLLADFAIESPEIVVSKVNPVLREDEKPLTLSTIHSAKGLEWNCVFLIGLMDGILPVSFSLNDDEGIEEEHRLFYVGITRSKDSLFLSFHHEGNRSGISQFNKISRFIDTPNILSKLEQDYAFAEKDGYKNVSFDDEFEDEPIFHDKKSLYKKVSDYFK